MADPQHQADLDLYDRVSVHTYRTGLLVAAIGLLLCAAAELEVLDPTLARWVVFTGSALSIANLHLYLKRIRAVIVLSGWVGAILLLAPVEQPLVSLAGLGFVFVSLSGFALKEQFCFRIPFLRAVPLLLATSLLPQALGAHEIAAALLALAGALFLVLALAKGKMPQHYDIGDKSKYEV
jgi:uncharacterized integral membrane protein